MKEENAPQLTDHEIRILRLVANGLTNKEIAGFLKIKQRTVEFHMSQVCRKLEVSSRATAILKAERLGLLNRMYE